MLTQNAAPNCSKLIIGRLQKRCHVTFLIYLFVTSRNLFVWCISAKENYYNLTKNSRKFQASVTKTCTFSVSAKSFKSTCEKVESLKILYCTWTSSQVIFKFSSRIFFQLLTYALIYRSLFVSYTTHILRIHIHICKRYYFPLLLFLRWKAKEK